MKEIWKDIPGYEELYQISSFGRVKNKSNSKTKKEKIKNLTLEKDGYYVVKLSKNNVKKRYFVHRLVAKTFLDEKEFKFIEGEDLTEVKKLYLVVNHKDKDKTNNRVDNLEWCTNRYNIKYGGISKKEKIIKYINKSNQITEDAKKDLLKLLLTF